MPVRSPRGVELLQGELFTLEPSAVHSTVVTNQAMTNQWTYKGERSRIIVACILTAAAAAGGDTLDVYVDVLAPDGATWLNAAHLTQMLGNGGAKSLYAVLDASNPGASTFDASADCAAGAQRPSLFGTDLRGRYTIAGATQSFTFGVFLYAMRGAVP